MNYQHSRKIKQLNLDNQNLCKKIEELEKSEKKPSSQKLTADNKKLKDELKDTQKLVLDSEKLVSELQEQIANLQESVEQLTNPESE